MKKELCIYPERCTGCRVCELACSKAQEGLFDPARSRIKPFKSRSSYIPFTCFQCENAYCERVCPTRAIYRKEESGPVLVDKQKCVGCKLCMLSCPFGMISIDLENGLAVKCDTCGGEPECVKHCIPEALRFEEQSDFLRSRKKRIFNLIEKEVL